MAHRLSALFFFCVSAFLAGPALAAPEEEVKALYEKGVAAYEDIDFDAARTNFEKALVIVARNPGKISSPLVAKVHIRAGVLYIAVDKDRAKGLKAFIAALKADPGAEVDPTLSNPEIDTVFQDAKEAVGVPSTPAGPQGPLLLSHKPPREATSNTPLRIYVELPKGMKAKKVIAHYRLSGQSKFTSLPLEEMEENVYESNIPGPKVKGKYLEYYISAEAAGGNILGLSGAADAPHLVQITSTEVDPEGATPASGKDPIDTGTPKQDTTSSHSFSFLLRVGGATGTVTGDTDSGRTLSGAGVSLPELTIEPEVAVYVNPKMTLGVSGRLQVTRGDRENGGQGAAAGGALRMRYFYGNSTGFRSYFAGEGGFGRIVQRFTALANGVAIGNDTDTDVGPSLGLGWGFENDISDSLAVTFDGTARGYFDLVDGLPVAQINLSLGIRLGN